MIITFFDYSANSTRTTRRENGKQFFVLYNLLCKERQPHATLHFYQLNATTILPRFIACPQNKSKATTTTKQQRVQHKTSNFGAAVAVRTRLKPSLRCACLPLSLSLSRPHILSLPLSLALSLLVPARQRFPLSLRCDISLLIELWPTESPLSQLAAQSASMLLQLQL